MCYLNYYCIIIVLFIAIPFYDCPKQMTPWLKLLATLNLSGSFSSNENYTFLHFMYSLTCRYTVVTPPSRCFAFSLNIFSQINVVNTIYSLNVFHRRLTWKLASPWSPRQKAYGIPRLDVGLFKKISFVADTRLWYSHVLFSKIIFTEEPYFCDFPSIKETYRSKMLLLGYKQTSLQLHYLNVTTTSIVSFSQLLATTFF